MTPLPDIHALLKKHWGYTSFRPLQEEIINSVLSGRPTLGLMPTGGGKSITFQVPAMALDGVAIVITPLISLMKDQVDNLRRRRIKAVYLHSGMKLSETRKAWELLTNGGARFLYVSPERLRNSAFIQDLRRLRLSMIVVDEAHCISQWGYDFRPAYLYIKNLIKQKPGVPVLALTATATPEVADDICRQLLMEDPAVLRMSFSRSNLSYVVRAAGSKIHEVFHILSRTSGSSIVYVRSRKRTREIAETLCEAGITATFYHAGLPFDLKVERQNAWQKGEIRVIVATNAFGMGIDKPDVRVVIHFDLPPSLEEYYQEAGRAGRDGLPSYAVLLTSPIDKATLRRKVTEAFPTREYIRKVYERVTNRLNLAIGEGYDKLYPFDFEDFCRVFKYQERQCRAALHLLGQAGYIEYLDETEFQSRIMITVPREELYHLHGISLQAEKVLQCILRSYPGLFADYVSINEVSIATASGFSEEDTYQALLELGRAGILSYIPRTRTPFIYMPTSREDTKYVMIGKDIYENRREIISRRVEAMIDYAFSDRKCREKTMLVYFGEKGGDKCGRCDVCRKEKIEKRNSRQYNERLIGEIYDFIKSRPGGVDFRIIEHNFRCQPQTLTELLSFLCNDGHVSLDNGIYTAVS